MQSILVESERLGVMLMKQSVLVDFKRLGVMMMQSIEYCCSAVATSCESSLPRRMAASHL
jgi:hypothetical protein